MKREYYDQLAVEEVYELARKKGILHDNSFSKEELLDMILQYDEENDLFIPEIIPYLKVDSGQIEFRMEETNYQDLAIQELYEIARKKGVRHDDSMSREELAEILTNYDKESVFETPETNPYSAKNPDSALKGEDNTIEGI